MSFLGKMRNTQDWKGPQAHFGAQSLPTNCQNGPQKALSVPAGGELALACAISTSGFKDSFLCSKSNLGVVLFGIVLFVSHFSLLFCTYLFLFELAVHDF